MFQEQEVNRHYTIRHGVVDWTADIVLSNTWNRDYTIRHGAVDRTTDIETVPFKVLSNALNSVRF